MKLLLDMNLAPRWAQYLQSMGLEAVHWSQLGRPDATDQEIMAHAAEFGFIVLTHDLDFSAILAATKGKKPSVVQLRAQDISSETIGLQVVAALKHSADALESGALLTIDMGRTRLRLLPLQESI